MHLRARLQGWTWTSEVTGAVVLKAMLRCGFVFGERGLPGDQCRPEDALAGWVLLGGCRVRRWPVFHAEFAARVLAQKVLSQRVDAVGLRAVPRVRQYLTWQAADPLSCRGGWVRGA
jgi:hypothetical protein